MKIANLYLSDENRAYAYKYYLKAIKNYNNKRPHNNIGRLAPLVFEKKVLSLPKQERPKVIIYTDVENRIEEASSL